MLALLLGLGVVAADPGPLHARFERGPAGATVVPEWLGKPGFATDVPGKFVYDPLARKSLVNASCLKLVGNDGATIAVPAGTGSFTLECFARAVEPKTEPGQHQPFLSRTGDTAATLHLGIFTSHPPHRYDWLQAFVTPVGGKPVELAWQRYGGMTMLGNENPWRHHALSFEATTGRLVYWLDYTPLAETTLPANTPWGDTVRAGGPAFRGRLDELRFTARALEPHDFLHALPHALKEVSLASPEGKLPRGTKYADIRTRFGAVGDGVTDDTHAFQKAFRDLSDNTHLVGSQTLYIPDGTYLISDTIRLTRYLTIQGQSRDKTVIRLRDNAGLFADPKAPRPVLSCGFQPYAEQVAKGNGGNITHGVYLYDLGIDTGSGNPGAIGFDYQGHNNSLVSGIAIRSGDGQGVAGLDLLRPWPGPCLIRELSVSGFERGVQVRHNEYSVTFHRLTLTGQREVGIRNEANGVCIENLTSTNTVPAIRNSAGGQIVLLDSKLTGGAKDATAIESVNGSLFVRNVVVAGYGTSIRDGEVKSPAGNVAEHHTGKAFDLWGKPGRSLNLPIEQPPEIPWDDLADWANVQDYAGRVKGDDWADAIQAAIDSGAKTVYFPINGSGPVYAVGKSVEVRGNVVRLFGMRNGVAALKSLGAAPAFVFAGTQKAVSIERLELPSVAHRSAVDLLVRAGGVGKIEASAGCGKLFLEDFLNLLRVGRHQRVWARHLNIESREYKIVNKGGQLWVLGYKTEILGGLVYVTENATGRVPMWQNEDGDIGLTHVTSCYVRNYEHYLLDWRGNEARKLSLKDAQQWLNGRPLMHLLTSRASEGK